jgi:molybdopterin synthase sulfur carrier subunit
MTEGLLRLRYFAWLRERLRRESEEIPLPPGVRTVGDLIAHQCARGGEFATLFGRSAVIRAAVNHVFATPETPVAPGDEIAFFPPVTGG